MAAAAAASLAGISALAAYLDAKYHIGQDLKVITRLRRSAKYYASLGTSSISFLTSRVDLMAVL